MALITALAIVVVLLARASPLGGDRDATHYQIFYRPVATSIAAGHGPLLDQEPAVR